MAISMRAALVSALRWAMLVFAILLGFGSVIAGRLIDGGQVRTWAFVAAIIGGVGLAVTQVLRWFLRAQGDEGGSADSA